MNKHDKNFLINFSPLLMAAVVMFLMLVAIETKAQEVGYTSDGIPILMEDLSAEARQELLEKEMAEADALLEEATPTTPVLVSIPYEVVDNEVIVAFGYGIRLIATYPCNVTPGDIVVPEPGLTEIGISTRFLVQRTLPDGRTMNYTCRVVNIYKTEEEKNDKED
tara:strand:- start:20 stop:514 length:495 start_codon:yes stop_codon:yes gene_type:complete